MKPNGTALRGAIVTTSAVLAAVLTQFTPVFGQDDTAPAPPPAYEPPHTDFCGSMQGGVWVSNGNCLDDTGTAASVAEGDGRLRGRISGTITSVSGHLVTLQQSSRSIVIDDQPALDLRETGRVAVGRQVTAHGYWQEGTFYATSMDDLKAST